MILDEIEIDERASLASVVESNVTALQQEFNDLKEVRISLGRLFN